MTEALVRPRFRRREFYRWLKKQSPDEPVGQSWSSEFCPLANYQYASTGQTVLVGGGTWQVVRGNRTLNGNLPRWAEKFEYAVDLHERWTDIYPEEAIRILQTVEDRLGLTAGDDGPSRTAYTDGRLAQNHLLTAVS